MINAEEILHDLEGLKRILVMATPETIHQSTLKVAIATIDKIITKLDIMDTPSYD